jgi:hypothetical protein
VQDCRQHDDVVVTNPSQPQLQRLEAAPLQQAQLRRADDVSPRPEAQLRARAFRAPTSLECGRPDRP